MFPRRWSRTCERPENEGECKICLVRMEHINTLVQVWGDFSTPSGFLQQTKLKLETKAGIDGFQILPIQPKQIWTPDGPLRSLLSCANWSELDLLLSKHRMIQGDLDKEPGQSGISPPSPAISLELPYANWALLVSDLFARISLRAPVRQSSRKFRLFWCGSCLVALVTFLALLTLVFLSKSI